MSTKITTQTTGSEITDRIITEEFTVAGKNEISIYQINADSAPTPISLANIGAVNKIIINSTSCNLNITDGIGSYVIPIAGFFNWTVSSDYVDIITSMTIDTNSVIAVDVDVTVCGE